MEVVLREQEELPSPLQAVALRLGYRVSVMRRYFPALCSQIVVRHTEYLRARKKQRMEEIAKETRQVVLRLHDDGIYPSHDRIAECLKRVGFNEETVRKHCPELSKAISWRYKKHRAEENQRRVMKQALETALANPEPEMLYDPRFLLFSELQ